MIKTKQTALEQASKWFLRMKDAAPDHADRSKFEAWLMSSEANRAAYQTIADTWEDFDSSEQIKQISQAMAMKKLDDDIRKRHKATQLAKLGALVMILITGLFGMNAWQSWRAKPLETVAQATAPSQMVTHYLSDGSKLTLDAHSQTQVLYYRDKRYVKLLQGQAVFEVVKDADRPFVVESAHARITVKGTRFLVNMINHKTIVAVDHGKVLVESLTNQPAGSVVLTNGQVAEASSQSAPHPVQKSAKDAFAFLQGRLIFDGAAMTEVTETLSRYRQAPVVNQSTTRTPISAVVDVTSLNTFVKALPSVAPVNLEESSTQTTVVDRKK